MNTDKNAIGEHHVLGESAYPRKLFPIRVYLCSSVVKLLFPSSPVIPLLRQQNRAQRQTSAQRHRRRAKQFFLPR